MVRNLPAPLTRIMRDLPFFHIAFSGGLDSRFICHVAKLLGCKFVAWHAKGPHIPANESESAINWARKNAIPLEIIVFDPLKYPNIAKNDTDRCYYCKKELFSRICAIGRIVMDGTHAEDLNRFRPGLKALQEMGVISPLAKAGLTKKEIRALACQTDLNNPDQKAKSCLITRFAYGIKPDYRLLHQLALAEDELATIAGPLDFRLRLLPSPLLQIEDGPSFNFEKARSILQKYNFENASIIRSKNVSGFFDAGYKPGQKFFKNCNIIKL